MVEPIRIELPTPFAIGTVNAYLLPGDPLTLVDAGARTAESLAALELALAKHHFRLGDIELLLLTHHHVDHSGLAAIVAEQAGCEVAACRRAADLLYDLGVTRKAEDAWAAENLRLHGAPDDVVQSVYAISESAADFSESVTVTRMLEAEDVVRAGGRDLRVLLAPGHSPSDTTFAAQASWAITGDHVLATGPVVVLAERPRGETVHPRERPPAIVEYRRTLAATAELELKVALPGHGPPVDSVAGTIAAQIEAQDWRAKKLLGVLTSTPKTAWDILSTIRSPVLRGGRHPLSEAFILLSGLVSHLDLLEISGRAHTAQREDGRVTYARSP